MEDSYLFRLYRKNLNFSLSTSFPPYLYVFLLKNVKSWKFERLKMIIWDFFKDFTRNRIWNIHQTIKSKSFFEVLLSAFNLQRQNISISEKKNFEECNFRKHERSPLGNQIRNGTMKRFQSDSRRGKYLIHIIPPPAASRPSLVARVWKVGVE